MRKILNWIIKSNQKRYSINRKYALKQYENIDLYVEGLETREEITKELECFDEMVKIYREKEEEIDNIEIEKINNQINDITQERPF